jgi:thiol-disulfide isomerase/thioredoxin/S1-C subfamily serine protease
MSRSLLFSFITFVACGIAARAPRAAAETVLLDFTSPTCGPCVQMEPTLRQMESQGVSVQRVDVSRDPRLAKQYRIDVTPTYVVVIDGREWARVTGVTPLPTMMEMMRKSAELAAKHDTVNVTNENSGSMNVAPPADEPQEGRMVPIGNPFASGARQTGPATVPAATQAAAAINAPAASGVDHLIAATVRLSVADPNGKSTGTGAIVAARDGMALVLTCGHIFRESQGRGAVEISIFRSTANGAELRGTVAGECLAYDLERDLALVRFRTESALDVTPIAPPGVQLQPGAPVVSVGCNHGENPTARSSHITTINRFQGFPNVEAAGAPVEGRSGGPLYNADGQVIGVCFAANPQDDEGLYASIASIHAKLDELKLTSVYAPGVGNPGLNAAPATQFAATAPPEPQVSVRGQEPTTEAPSALAGAWPAPTAEAPRAAAGTIAPGHVKPTSGAAASAVAASLPAAEQAALEEIARRSAGAEVICIIRPQDPSGRSDVIKLSGVSPEFVRTLTAAAQTANTAGAGSAGASVVR